MLDIGSFVRTDVDTIVEFHGISSKLAELSAILHQPMSTGRIGEVQRLRDHGRQLAPTDQLDHVAQLRLGRACTADDRPLVPEQLDEVEVDHLARVAAAHDDAPAVGDRGQARARRRSPPTCSSTTSTPRPSVASRTRAARSSVV